MGAWLPCLKSAFMAEVGFDGSAQQPGLNESISGSLCHSHEASGSKVIAGSSGRDIERAQGVESTCPAWTLPMQGRAELPTNLFVGLAGSQMAEVDDAWVI